MVESGRHYSVTPARPTGGSQFNVYVLGRPLMLVLWGIAIWGTLAAVRLCWIAITQGGTSALRLLSIPSVFIPIGLAAAMWVAVTVAVKRFYRDGEP